MARFLIEVPHKDDFEDCVKAINVLVTSGSHFLTNADWGCADGEHKAWVVAELESKEEARAILPPYYRAEAKITRLKKFTTQDMDKIRAKHPELKF